MKSLSFFSLLVFLLSACSTPPPQIEPMAEAKTCSSSVTATVAKTSLNEDGTEFFLHLQLDQDGARYYDNISRHGLQVGDQVLVEYRPTPKEFTYIACLPGHSLDTNNPDIQSLPIIEVCNLSKIRPD